MRSEPLMVSDSDRRILESRIRAQTLPRRDWQRTMIVLMAAKGHSNREIGDTVVMNVNDVAKWRKRYAAKGLDGLADLARSGRPPIYGPHERLRLVKTITEVPPAPKSRWTMSDVARYHADDIGISASQVWRICSTLELKPWQVRSWMTSHDRDFWAKAADICDLYLNPPEGTTVFGVDEKTGMQARSRKNPTRPAQPGGLPARQEFEYVRHGTAVLFAAVEVHAGEVTHWVTDSTRAENFIHFLNRLDALTPAHHEMHCVCDNLSAHGTPDVEAWLDAHPRVFLHRTPTHASWLNQAELVFSIFGRGLLTHGEFESTPALAMAIDDYFTDYNQRAQPFNWRYAGRPRHDESTLTDAA